MYGHHIIAEARSLYIFKAMDLPAIARNLGIPQRTIARWRRQAKANQDCWDNARNNALKVTGASNSDVMEGLLLEFITFFNATIAEVKQSSDLTPIDKAKIISTLGDAYTKVIKSTNKADPHKSALAIAFDVMKKFVNYLESVENHQALEQLVPELQNFGEFYKKSVAKQ